MNFILRFALLSLLLAIICSSALARPSRRRCPERCVGRRNVARRQCRFANKFDKFGCHVVRCSHGFKCSSRAPPPPPPPPPPTPPSPPAPPSCPTRDAFTPCINANIPPLPDTQCTSVPTIDNKVLWFELQFGEENPDDDGDLDFDVFGFDSEAAGQNCEETTTYGRFFGDETEGLNINPDIEHITWDIGQAKADGVFTGTQRFYVNVETNTSEDTVPAVLRILLGEEGDNVFASDPLSDLDSCLTGLGFDDSDWECDNADNFKLFSSAIVEVTETSSEVMICITRQTATGPVA